MEVLRLAEFLKGLESFDGTATELAALWEGYAGEPVQPSVLSKKLARYAGELDKLGVHITTSRTRESRSLHLRCDSSDGSDGKNKTEPVSDLLSQPSHLSTGAAYAPVRACVDGNARGWETTPSQ